MNIKALATAAAVIAIGLSSAIPAQAYTLHYWQDGTITWMCNDGITVGVMDDGSMPPEEVIIAHCADRGGMATDNSGFGATTAAGIEKRGPAIVSSRGGQVHTKFVGR